MKPESILVFWFKELEPKQWFEKDITLDRHITERFADFHAAEKTHMADWQKSSFWISFHAISIATNPVRLPAIRWHLFWPRKPLPRGLTRN